MIITIYVQGFSRIVSIKKNPNKLFTASGCTQFHVCGFRKKKIKELNRYKVLINGKIIYLNIIRYIFQIMFYQYNYISMI